MTKFFKSLEKGASYYRKRIIVIYALAAFVFLVGGVAALTLDSVTLLGRYSAAHFEGTSAYVAGIFCFFVAAYWVSSIVRESHGGRLMSLVPFVVAAVVSVVLMAHKYG